MVEAPLRLFDSFQAAQPIRTVFRILLNSRSQFGLVQVEIVHGADAQNTCPWEPRADTIHEGAAGRTEIVGHGIVQADGVVLAKGFEVVAAADVLQIVVVDDEVGCEHGCRDFVAVIAVADEAVDHSWALSWLKICKCCQCSRYE